MLKIALFFSGAGSVLALICLFRTTALTMAFFFSFGLLFNAIGILLFTVYIIQSLKRLLEIDGNHRS